MTDVVIRYRDEQRIVLDELGIGARLIFGASGIAMLVPALWYLKQAWSAEYVLPFLTASQPPKAATMMGSGLAGFLMMAVAVSGCFFAVRFPLELRRHPPTIARVWSNWTVGARPLQPPFTIILSPRKYKSSWRYVVKLRDGTGDTHLVASDDTRRMQLDALRHGIVVAKGVASFLGCDVVQQGWELDPYDNPLYFE